MFYLCSAIDDDVDDAATDRSVTENTAHEDEEASLVQSAQRSYVYFFYTFDRSPIDVNSSRRPSQKAVYMADTPTRKQKDNVAQRS